MSIEADLFVPAFPAANAALLFCIAGSGFDRDVFSLGEPRDDTNFANAMTARGHVVVAVDLAGGRNGIGSESERMQRAIGVLRTRVVSGIRLGQLPVIGVGHAEGGMVVGVLQGTHNVFDGVALLGFSLAGRPLRLSNEKLFALRSSGPEAAVADLALMPGNVATELGMITSPVFVVASERDGAGAMAGIVAALTSCPDYTCFTIVGGTPALFDAGRIGSLYERFNNWLTAIVVARSGLSEPRTTVGK